MDWRKRAVLLTAFGLVTATSEVDCKSPQQPKIPADAIPKENDLQLLDDGGAEVHGKPKSPQSSRTFHPGSQNADSHKGSDRDIYSESHRGLKSLLDPTRSPVVRETRALSDSKIHGTSSSSDTSISLIPSKSLLFPKAPTKVILRRKQFQFPRSNGTNKVDQPTGVTLFRTQDNVSHKKSYQDVHSDSVKRMKSILNGTDLSVPGGGGLSDLNGERPSSRDHKTSIHLASKDGHAEITGEVHGEAVLEAATSSNKKGASAGVEAVLRKSGGIHGSIKTSDK